MADKRELKQQHKTLQERLHAGRLSGPQRNQAWQIFRAEGYDAALAFAAQIEAALPPETEPVRIHAAALPYQVWGREQIDDGALAQMSNAMRLPIVVAGALMPDAHIGYGLPIGGVLATEGAVIPYAVGVDIACRMMLTVYHDTPDVLDQTGSKAYRRLETALIDRTIFGAGGDGLHDGIYEHPVLYHDRWQATPLLRELRRTAIHQLGTSGTGNHFVEWGRLTITQPDNPLHLAPGAYLALLSHSGSRGVGYKIADYYSKLAMNQMAGLDDSVKHLAWLSLESEAGQEYWHAMTLAGEFASANHHIIHAQVAEAAGLEAVAAVENHHNFAWQETILVNGVPREVIVHRKGATPAGAGVLGIIPGTMADVGYVVIGKGEAASLNSASHGGGRKMSRSQAKKTVTKDDLKFILNKRGVKLIGGGLDEAPQAYKRIDAVITAQADLVGILGEFQPKLVRMADDKPLRGRKAAPAGIVDQEGD